MLYVFIILTAFLTSCNQKQIEIETDYSELPETKKKEFEEVLMLKDESITEESLDVMGDYAIKYILASSNPVGKGIVSNYFWYVYNALPEFVDQNIRHQGYYSGDNEQTEEERLIAYAIYKIDRSPENLNKLFEIIKPEMKNFVSYDLYHSLKINMEIEKRIRSYKLLNKIENYEVLLTEAYNHADTATGILYNDGINQHFEVFNNAYGLDVQSLNEIICQYLQIDRYDPLYGNHSLSFWMRRNKEGNMDVVYNILEEVQSVY